MMVFHMYLGPGAGTLPALSSSIMSSMSLGVRSSWKSESRIVPLFSLLVVLCWIIKKVLTVSTCMSTFSCLLISTLKTEWGRLGGNTQIILLQYYKKLIIIADSKKAIIFRHMKAGFTKLVKMIRLPEFQILFNIQNFKTVCQ